MSFKNHTVIKMSKSRKTEKENTKKNVQEEHCCMRKDERQKQDLAEEEKKKYHSIFSLPFYCMKAKLLTTAS